MDAVSHSTYQLPKVEIPLGMQLKRKSTAVLEAHDLAKAARPLYFKHDEATLGDGGVNDLVEVVDVSLEDRVEVSSSRQV